MNIIGTCSLCGGPVGHEAIYMSVIPRAPRCQRCGATKKAPFGPVIEMEPTTERYDKTRGGHPLAPEALQRSPYTEDQTGVARARSYIAGDWKLSDD